MKILLSFAFIFVFAVNNIFASGVLFKASKQIKFGDWVELGTFTTDNWRSIRISVETDNTKFGSSIDIDAIEPEGVYNLDEVGDRVTSYSKVFETPPPKIRVRVKGEGKYNLTVWASE